MQNQKTFKSRRILSGIRRMLAKLIRHKQYAFEYEFFERIRNNSYSDIAYREARLRNTVHALDKTLVFENISPKDRLAGLISSQL